MTDHDGRMRDSWTSDDDVLLAALAAHGLRLSRADLDHVVATNDKRRFAYDESGARIRASQGHSVPVDLGLEQVEPPPFLYHGTVQRFLGQILKQGLVPGKRHHVHLSADIPTAALVAGRRHGDTVILEIASGAMREQSFFRSANGVWLVAHVPPEFLRVLRPTP